MTYVVRPNSGTLGRNLNKNQPEHPDYSGKLNIDGVPYKLSAWLKTNEKTGSKFFSLSVRPTNETPAARPSDEPDDQLPF